MGGFDSLESPLPGYVWDLSGSDNRCSSHGPGHQIHWIHFNHSMREPSVAIPVTASVDDDGLVHIEGDDLSLVGWNHRPALLRAALQSFGGRADCGKPQRIISIQAPKSSSRYGRTWLVE
jgi:hypothetical protein